MTAIHHIIGIIEILQMMQAFQIILNASGAFHAKQGIDIDGITGKQNAVLTVQKHQCSPCVARYTDGFQFNSAKIQNIPVIKRLHAHRASLNDIIDGQ